MVRPGGITRLSAFFALGFLAFTPALVPQIANALCMARPYYRSPDYLRAKMLMHQGRTHEAEVLFRKAARWPGQARSWIGQAWYQAGVRALGDSNFQKAARYFGRALRYRAVNEFTGSQLLRALRNAGRLDAALQRLAQFPRTLRERRRILIEEARLHAQRRDEVGLQDVLTRLRQRGWLKARHQQELRSLARGPLLTAPGALDI